MGIDVETIGRTLETLLGGRQVTRFKKEGKQYDVIVQLEAKDRDTPTDLTSIFVRARDGRLVQLSNLVKVRETVGPKELNHFNRLRATILSANVAPGYTLGEALAVPRGRREGGARRERAHRAGRPVARIPGVGRRAARHLRPCAGVHLPRARGAVRELRVAVRHHADGAAGDDRRARRAQAHRRHAERVFADRSGDADRPDHQARHPDRRVRQPAARRRAWTPPRR